MKHLEILGSFYSGNGLRAEAKGLAIVACFLVAGALFFWQVIRSLKKDAPKSWSENVTATTLHELVAVK